MTRDKLFLLKPGFADPAYPGETFYCWHCALMEGVLASFPALAARIEVEHVAFPRPRGPVVAMAGEANQSLPLLVLADDAPDELATGRHGWVRFVADKDRHPRRAEPSPRLPHPASLIVLGRASDRCPPLRTPVEKARYPPGSREEIAR
jgi:hypothetical protein